MQPATNAARSAVGKSLPALALQASKRVPDATTSASAAVPQWLSEIEQTAQAENERAASRAADAQVSRAEPAPEQKGVTYSLWLGADLKLFSTARSESHLKNMHEPNHRELRIAKFAGRVADMLWPGCQENIDEAIAKHKVMASKTRIHIPEPEYEPPQVPHVLPFTNWIRNNASLRESFVVEANSTTKPRMAWYNPNDGMIPSGWLTEGLLADLAYYKPFASRAARAP